MINDLQKAIKKLRNDKLYSSDDIVSKGLILDNNLKPSRFTLYRRIKQGVLPAVNLGTDKMPKYFVKGEELKKYLNQLYKLN
jgi:hypothetical protein